MFCLTCQIKNTKKLRRNSLLDAGWLTNLPWFQGARPDHVRVESCCFPRELVGFAHPRELVKVWPTARDTFSSNRKTYLSWEVQQTWLFLFSHPTYFVSSSVTSTLVCSLESESFTNGTSVLNLLQRFTVYLINFQLKGLHQDLRVFTVTLF